MEPAAETVAQVGWLRLPLDIRLSPRDIAYIVGISFQRVQQILGAA